MDLAKLIEIAGDLNVPGLVERGAKIAADLADYAALVKTNATRAGHVLAAGDAAQLEAIHVDALAVNGDLDTKLVAAALR